MMNNNTPAAAAQMEREQGERFLQLSQRCHQQNWAAVHALAEQILYHKNDPKDFCSNNDLSVFSYTFLQLIIFSAHSLSRIPCKFTKQRSFAVFDEFDQL